MPILYENVFQKRPTTQRLVQTLDSQKSLTVTLAAGKGVIINANAFDQTGTNISKAYAGQGIGLQVQVQNQGDTDTIWIDIKDKDTGAIIVRTDGIKCMTSAVVNGSAYLNWTAASWVNGVPNLLMPNKNFNLLIEAGHGS
jgi:hypothetical protein